MSELTRTERDVEDKKIEEYASLKDFVGQLVENKATSTDKSGKIAELNDAIAAIGDGLKEDAIKATALYIEIVARYNLQKTNADNVVTAKRAGMTELHAKVIADDDYSAEQKTDFTDAKTNEV